MKDVWYSLYIPLRHCLPAWRPSSPTVITIRAHAVLRLKFREPKLLQVKRTSEVLVVQHIPGLTAREFRIRVHKTHVEVLDDIVITPVVLYTLKRRQRRISLTNE